MDLLNAEGTLMLLHQDTAQKETTSFEKAAVFYHDIFDFPLTLSETIKWACGEEIARNFQNIEVSCNNNFYFLKGKSNMVLKRMLRKRVSQRKMALAKRYAKIVAFIPTVRLIAVSGALAMENATDESDIDFFIMVQRGTVWLTRGVALVLLKLLAVPVRKYGDRNQKDKLCLNMWLDENDLVWEKKNRNIFTAHEIAQLMPLVNKNKSYQMLIKNNKWIGKYWPNAIKPKYFKSIKKINHQRPFWLVSLFEKMAFKLQLAYMKKKITKELVTPTKAFFHPFNWEDYILTRLNINQRHLTIL